MKNKHKLLSTVLVIVALISCNELHKPNSTLNNEDMLIDSTMGTPNSPFTLTIESKILNENRKIYVQLPVDYKRDNKRYPVLFVLDGEWLFDLANAHQRYYSYDEVTDQTIPRMIVVGIENSDRDKDYVPTNNSGVEGYIFPTAGGANDFISFLEKELIPLIDKKYRTFDHRCLVGWSFSGLFTTYAAAVKPDLFNMHLCISPAIWWDNDLVYNQFLNAKFNKPKRMLFTLGTKEEGGMVYPSTMRLVDELRDKHQKNLELDLIMIQDVGHTWGVATAINKGLQWLYSDYIPSENITSEADMNRYFEELSENWSYKVTPPGKVFINVAYNLWSEGKDKEAIALLKKGVKLQKNDSQLFFILGQMLSAIGRDNEALIFYEKAILVEKNKAVPNEVNLRGFSEIVKSTKESLSDSLK